jgi:signal transduction histidine kinase
VLPVWLNLDSCSIIRLATLVLSLSIATYLASRRGRSKATFFLALTFYGAALFNLSSFLEFAGLYYWQPRNMKNLLVPFFQDIGPAGALLNLVLFAYFFPILPGKQKKELWSVVAVLTVLNLGMLALTTYNFVLLERRGSSYRFTMAYYSILYGFLGAQVVLVVVLLLRRSVLLSSGKTRPWWRKLLRPAGRSATTARSLALSLLLLVAALGCYVFLTYGFLPLAIATYLIWLSLLLFYFSFLVTYLNHATEPSSFQVKLVGLTLIPVLSLLGLIALFVGKATETDYRGDNRLPGPVSILFRPNGSGSYDLEALPVRFEAALGRRLDIGYGERQAVEAEFDFLFFGRSYRTLQVLHSPMLYLGQTIRENGWGGYHPNPAIAPLLLNLDPSRGAGIFLNSGPRALTVTWLRLPELGFANANTVQLTLHDDGSFTMSLEAIEPQGRYSSVQMYNFTTATTTGRHPGSRGRAEAFGPRLTGIHPGTADAPLQPLRLLTDLPYSSLRPEIIFESFEAGYSRYLHFRMSVLALLLLASSLFILFVFPVLFRTNLIRPLRSLAEAMRRADGGNLHVNVQPQFRDEIGFLARSFNRMLKSIRNTEASLVQANRLNSLGVLLAAMAHQINVPNQSILTNVSLLSKACPDLLHILERCAPETAGYLIGGLEDSEFRRILPEALAAAENASKNIDGIIKGLRAFSREDPAPLMTSLDIGAVVHAAVDLAGGYLRRATDRFTLELAPALPGVRGNAQRLEQALVNLLVNACEALPDRRKAIALHALRAAGGGEIRIKVTDEGSGIPPEILPHLKERFFTTKRATGGTGLGLFVAEAIITEHRGSLRLASVPGQGTVATVILPAEVPG